MKMKMKSENETVAHVEEIMELKLHKWMDKETIKEITRKNAEANQMVEELSRKLSACEDAKKTSELKNDELRRRVMDYEEDKKTANLVLEEMKIKETENFKCLEDLRRKNMEAERKVEELGGRVSALEGQKVETDKRMKEMKDRESDLRRQILEACKAVEVKIKRFENVLPIAGDLWKLLKRNVDDLVRTKEKFVWGAGEEGLISSLVVSRNVATATNGKEAGPHDSNKAVELAVYATEQPTKKRKTTPSSAAVIIECDKEAFFRSGSYGVSPLIPKRKRSKRAVRVNESLIKRKRMFGTDMVRAFEEDDELCLHAVCALHKQHVPTSQSTETSGKRFYHFEYSLRGCALADYLTCGDPELSLTRPVDEVKQQYPDIVNQCRGLAIHYSSYFTAEVPRTYEPLSLTRSR